MAYIACSQQDYSSWDYMQGTRDFSIVVARRDRLMELTYLSGDKMLVSCHDRAGGFWTKHETIWKRGNDKDYDLAYDVHRSILPNEIVIESDMPDFHDNYEAARSIGKILEAKGYKPMYYYSGGKSIHIHIFLDPMIFAGLDSFLQESILKGFTKHYFFKQFMEYLREKVITLWGIKKGVFDEQLIKGNHLIRSELSRNSKGFKTFLGYEHKDLSFVPTICNETNGFYPTIGEVRFSKPKNFQQEVEGFLQYKEDQVSKRKVARKEFGLLKYLEPEAFAARRPCVDYLLSEDFEGKGDGTQRAMFILSNELKGELGEEQAYEELSLWNSSIGSPLRDNEMSYRVFEHKHYNLSCKYIQELLDSTGCRKCCTGCKRKV